jgi:hypothetical protein
MSDPQLEWDQAEVRDGKLRLPVSGTRPRGWSESFERTVRLLGGDWKKVKLKKRRVQVDGVQPGSEEKLRHFLESAVQQANEEHRDPDSRSGPGERDGTDQQPRAQRANPPMPV